MNITIMRHVFFSYRLSALELQHLKQNRYVAVIIISSNEKVLISGDHGTVTRVVKF